MREWEKVREWEREREWESDWERECERMRTREREAEFPLFHQVSVVLIWKRSEPVKVRLFLIVYDNFFHYYICADLRFFDSDKNFDIKLAFKSKIFLKQQEMIKKHEESFSKNIQNKFFRHKCSTIGDFRKILLWCVCSFSINNSCGENFWKTISFFIHF